MRNSTKTALSIAGFDPSSGAGITADLAVMAAHGYFGTSAITALTVQSTLGVKSSHPVDPQILKDTLDFLTEDLAPSAVKIGLLGSAENVQVVADYIHKSRLAPTRVPIVLDPVICSSSGRELLNAQAVDLLRDRLLPLVDWITPNRAELAALLGREISNDQEIEAAAQELTGWGRGLNVVVTGGDGDASDFVWLAGGEASWLRGERIVSTSTHGTGCAFSTSLLCRIADGKDGEMAACGAKQYVTEAIRRAFPRGGGKGPLNLLWPLT